MIVGYFPHNDRHIILCLTSTAIACSFMYALKQLFILGIKEANDTIMQAFLDCLFLS